MADRMRVLAARLGVVLARLSIPLVVCCAAMASLIATSLASSVASIGEGPGSAEIAAGISDDGRLIQLDGGQTLVVSLESGPSTGYRWEMAGPVPSVLTPDGPVQFVSRERLFGAPGTEILRFKPTGVGQAGLELAYRRPWEALTATLRTYSLQVATSGGAGGQSGPPDPSSPADSAPPSQSAELAQTAESRSTERGAESAAGPSAPRRGAKAVSANAGVPAAYNWCDHGGCTPVKDQGSCGSCWAFATVAPLESAIAIRDGVARDLSEQYLVSCNIEGADPAHRWGCSGGYWAHDYYLQSVPPGKVPPGEPGTGAVAEADFAYVAYDAACGAPHEHSEQIVSYSFVGERYVIPTRDVLKQAIYEHGPLAVGICVGPEFQSYTGGVFLANEVCGGDINHSVLLVGWDDTQGPDGIWYIKNSWGTGWGELGYMRIGTGVSSVGFDANYVTYGGPAHDDIDNARAIPTVPYTDTENIQGATSATDDPTLTCAGNRGAATVWYRFTPPSSGTMTVDTAGSVYDTVLAVWQGTRGSLVEVGCNDDVNSVNNKSSLKVHVEAGVVYYVEAADYEGGGGKLTIHANFGGLSASPISPDETPTPTPGLPLPGPNRSYLPVAVRNAR